MNVDEMEVRAVEALIRLAGALEKEGHIGRAAEVINLSIKNFRETCFHLAVGRIREEGRPPRSGGLLAPGDGGPGTKSEEEE